MTDEATRTMLHFPLDGGELLDAVRLAEALERLETGRPAGIDPAEDPALAALIDTAARLRADLGMLVTGQGFHSFRSRSRAAVLHALEDATAPAAGSVAGAGGPANITALPPHRRSLVVRALHFSPLAAAAAAASMVVALLASGGGTPPASPAGGDALVGQTGAPRASSGTMLGPDTSGRATLTAARSTNEELDHLTAAIADIKMYNDSGQLVPAPLLRAVSEGAAKVANAIEQRPAEVSKETVTTYINAAQTSQTVLNNATVEDGAQGALAVAQRTARDGVVVAARFLLGVTPDAAVAAAATSTPAAASTTDTPVPTATASAGSRSSAASPPPVSPMPTAVATETATPTPVPTAAPTAPSNDIAR